MWPFKKKPVIHPQDRMSYIVSEGNLKGTFVLFFDLYPKGEVYYALAIGEDPSAYGGMRILEIPTSAVIEAFKHGILDSAGIIPSDKWEILHSEYIKRMEMYDLSGKNDKDD